MATKYSNSLAEISAVYPTTPHTAHEWKNESKSYSPVTETITVPATPDAEGRYRIELDHEISQAQSVTVTVDGVTLTPVAYGAAPAADEAAICTDGAPIVEFNSTLKGKAGSVVYTPIASMVTATRMNTIEKQLASVQGYASEIPGTTATTFVISRGANFGTGGMIQFGPEDDNISLSASYNLDLGSNVYTLGGIGCELDCGYVQCSAAYTNELTTTNGYIIALYTDTIAPRTTVNGLTLGSAKINFTASGNEYKGTVFSAPTSGVNRYSVWIDQPSGGTVNAALVVDGGSTISNATASVQIKGNGCLSVVSNGGILCGSGQAGGYGTIRAGSLQISGNGNYAYSFAQMWYRGTGSNADDGSVGIAGFAHSVGAIAPIHKIWNGTSGVNNVPTKMQFQAMGTGDTILELCKPSATSGTTLYTDNPLRITRNSTGVMVDVVDATADQLLTFTNSNATYDLKVSFDAKAIGFFGATPATKPTVTLTGTASTDIAAIKAALVSLGLVA